MSGDRPAGLEEVPELHSLDEIVQLQREVGQVYLRYSRGPAVDAGETSRDKESGCVLPGLSTNPITPEPWWDRPPQQWVARQLCQYEHLLGGDQVGWLLTGREAGRGPDCEPLLADTTPLASIAPECVEEARRVYQGAFEPGRR